MKKILGIYADADGMYRVYENLSFDTIDIDENDEIVVLSTGGILTRAEFAKLEKIA